jgi:ornithine cyclodeaminase/alanine dehydrogenase-like protein (mu-crystallin family)
VTDVTDQCAEFGELHHILAAGVMDRDEVRAELGEIAAGVKAGRRHPDERIVFDSTGTPIQDAAAAAAAYDRSRALDLGAWFTFRS